MSTMLRAIALLLAALSISLCPTVAVAREITVSAAVSLKEALAQIAASYEHDHPDRITLNFGASGALLAQIRQGAPVDLYISASEQEMDQADRAGVIDPATRTVICRNQLVLIVPSDANVQIKGFSDLTRRAIKHLAIGQPSSVPAGMYAQQALKHLKIWDALQPRLVYGASVRQVLAYVEQGEVDAGIVYTTDARISGQKVRIIATAEADSHDPIRYVAALVKGKNSRDVSEMFLRYLSTKGSLQVFAKFGFSPPADPHKK
jgi:molybdate transport system substrate-binding protein